MGRAFRRTEVKVTRGGTKVQHGNGYIATPPDDAGPMLAYELPLLEALKSPEANKDFPVTAGTFAFSSSPEGREVTLVAELPISSFKVTTDPVAKLYKLHFALLALVKDAQGQTVERVSQDYPFQGPLDKLPQLQQGNVVFKRKLVVPPGLHPGARGAGPRQRGHERTPRPARRAARGRARHQQRRDRAADGAGAPRPAGRARGPAAGRGHAHRAEPRRPHLEGDDREAPRVRGRLPGARRQPPPQMTLEFSSDGKAEGRNSVVLPAPDPDGRIRFLAPIPIEKYAPGRHELKVTVRQAGAQAEERVALTLEP